MNIDNLGLERARRQLSRPEPTAEQRGTTTGLDCTKR